MIGFQGDIDAWVAEVKARTDNSDDTKRLLILCDGAKLAAEASQRENARLRALLAECRTVLEALIDPNGLGAVARARALLTKLPGRGEGEG